MKKITGMVRLYPATGKIVSGVKVKYNKDIYTVKSIKDNMVTLDDNKVVNINDCRLHKLFVVSTSSFAELHYSNYKDVVIDTKHSFECSEIPTRGQIGDKVEVYKFYAAQFSIIKFPKKRLPGIIVDINNNIYDIKLLDGSVIKCKRHNFKLNIDTKWVATLILK